MFSRFEVILQNVAQPILSASTDIQMHTRLVQNITHFNGMNGEIPDIPASGTLESANSQRNACWNPACATKIQTHKFIQFQLSLEKTSKVLENRRPIHKYTLVSSVIVFLTKFLEKGPTVFALSNTGEHTIEYGQSMVSF